MSWLLWTVPQRSRKRRQSSVPGSLSCGYVWIFRALWNGCSDRCGDDISLWVWFASPWLYWVPFHVSVYFGEMSIMFLCPFLIRFGGGFRFMSSLCILNVNPLWDMWLTNIFPHFVGCFFILLMVSFAVKMLFSLMELVPLVDCFCYFHFWYQSGTITANSSVKELTPYVFLQF